jgi:5-methylcytosine-specific restriction endonuclease McrA
MAFSIDSHRNRRKYALLRNDLSEREWLWLIDITNGFCVKCGLKWDATHRPTIDHIYSDADGLIDGTTLRNVQPLCQKCNSRKGNHHTKDWRTEEQRWKIWQYISKNNKTIRYVEKKETMNLLLYKWFDPWRLKNAYRNYRESKHYRPLVAA